MNKGIGLDICDVSRMEKLLQDDRFLNRYFTPGEIEYIRSRGHGAGCSLAGLFASREALGKALGTGIDFDLKEAEIRHTAEGAPFYHLSGKLKQRVGNDRLHLSISHDGGFAAAVCLIESVSDEGGIK
jgi:holo-[acyl-carrier protein] synthase